MNKRILSLILTLLMIVSLVSLSPVYAEDEEEESRYAEQPTMANGLTAVVNTEGLVDPVITYTWYTKETKDLSDFSPEEYEVICGSVDGNSITSGSYVDEDEWEWDYMELHFTDHSFDRDTITYIWYDCEYSLPLSGSDYQEFWFKPTTITDVKITCDKVMENETAATLSGYEPGELYRCDVTLNDETLKGEWVQAGYTMCYIDTSNPEDPLYCEDNKFYDVGDEIVLASDSELQFFRDNARLTGWNTADDGSGIDYDFGETYTFGNTDAYFYAVWAPIIIGQPTAENGYTVTLDPYFTDAEYYWYRWEEIGGSLSEAEYVYVSEGCQDGNDIASVSFDDSYLVDFSLAVSCNRPATVSFDCDRTLDISDYELLSQEGNRYTYSLGECGNFYFCDDEAFTLSNISYTSSDSVWVMGQDTNCLTAGEEGQEYFCCINAGNGDYYATSDSFFYSAPKCIRYTSVLFSALKDGCYRMTLGGTEAGLYDILRTDGGYTLCDTESGQYVCAGEDGIFMSDTADTVWSKGLSSFYVGTTETKKGLFGITYTAKVRHYLSAEADGALSLSDSTVTTKLARREESEKHLYVYQTCGDGTHKAYCLRCGEGHKEACSLSRLGLCTQCGGVNLKEKLSLLSFLLSLKK